MYSFLYETHHRTTWSVTCRMGSHSVTCHPILVNTSRLNPSQIRRYSIYLPRKDVRLSWPRRLVTYQNDLTARRQPSIKVLTRSDVEQLRCSDTLRYRYVRHLYLAL